MNKFQERCARAIRNSGNTVVTLHESRHCVLLLVVHIDDIDLIERIAVNPTGKIIGRAHFRRVPEPAKAVTPATSLSRARQDARTRSTPLGGLASVGGEVRALRK